MGVDVAEERLCAEPFRKTASRTAPFWLWLNLLSLDAPLVALVWQEFLARCYPSVLRPAGRWALFLTVWAIYIGDRLLDVRGAATENESARHGFYRRNGKFAAALLIAVMLADFAIALLWLRPAVFAGGMLAGTGVVCYLAVFPFWRVGGSSWKQPCAAMLFTSGVFLVAWAGVADAPRMLSGPAAAFFALCLGNMTLTEGRRRSWRVWAAMSVLAAVCAAWCALAPPHSKWYRAVTTAAIGLAALDFRGGALSRDTRGVLADLVLLTPLLLR